MEDWVDFDDSDITNKDVVIDEKKYDKEYNSDTTEFYKNMREKKYNIISHDVFNCNTEHVFKFKEMWDPYTGERIGDDPFGSLYFHPDELIRFYYKRRLKTLWTDQKDETGGVYEGYYGDGVGSGEEINIPGRGIYPELYLFRLPIDDCYLAPNTDRSIITMGPKLTDEEVKLIDELAEKYHKDNYRNSFGKKRPSLYKMKLLYDTAISKHPDISKYCVDEKNMSKTELEELRNRANRDAVNELINYA